jgi:hypothetical protein
MNEKEFEKYREEAIRFYLARCLEMKLVSFKRKKDFKALFSLFNSAIRVSFDKGQLSVYGKDKKLKDRSLASTRFWKDMEKRYEVR